jgi:DNA-binding HxlR family transcriptional regulator
MSTPGSYHVATLDRVIHEPARLMIVALLFSLARADFVYLLRETGLSTGNLSVQLANLEQAGYLRIEKTFRGKLPLTTCALTPEGRAAFDRYRAQVVQLLSAPPGDAAAAGEHAS